VNGETNEKTQIKVQKIISNNNIPQVVKDSTIHKIQKYISNIREAENKDQIWIQKQFDKIKIMDNKINNQVKQMMDALQVEKKQLVSKI
jgi:hypothetical protein